MIRRRLPKSIPTREAAIHGRLMASEMQALATRIERAER
jgi:hypothetical protein